MLGHSSGHKPTATLRVKTGRTLPQLSSPSWSPRLAGNMVQDWPRDRPSHQAGPWQQPNSASQGTRELRQDERVPDVPPLVCNPGPTSRRRTLTSSPLTTSAGDGDAQNEMSHTCQGILPCRSSRGWEGDDVREPQTYRQRYSLLLRQGRLPQASKYW